MRPKAVARDNVILYLCSIWASSCDFHKLLTALQAPLTCP